MEYQTILTIKESDKATVELAAVEWQEGPVIVKKLRGVKPDIYRLLCHAPNSYMPHIYSCKQQGDILYVVEEYVEGKNLAEYVEKNTLTVAETLALALQLCAAVEVLHSMNPPVIHRDIKPSNILVNRRGELKLIDFDAARQYKAMRESGDTRLLGTVEYAPPEQFGYSQTDVRSDIYSMGVVFQGMPLKECGKLDGKWQKIANKCVNFAPKDRYQNVAELKREIEKLIPGKTKKWNKIAAWIGSIVLVAGMAVAAGMGLWKSRGKEVGNGTEMVTGIPGLSQEPVGALSTAPTPTEKGAIMFTPAAEPSLTSESSPMPELSPTLEPSPTLMPSPTLEPSPTLMPSPTLTPVPTLKLSTTPEPSVTQKPSPTEIPNLSEKMKWIAYNVITPYPAESAVYNYYKAEQKNTELIFSFDVLGLDITMLGGMCYRYETEEFIYIPPEQLDGGPTYFRVSDEFVTGLEPGLYHFYIARETEAGRIGYSGRGAEIYSEEVQLKSGKHRLINEARTFYSEYQRDIAIVLYPDTVSRVNGLYVMERQKKEVVDASCYEITCDGKVLLIKKEFLEKHLEEEELEFVVAFDDGQEETAKVILVKGVHEGLIPTPTPSLSPTVTPVPTPIAAAWMPDIIPHSIIKN